MIELGCILARMSNVTLPTWVTSQPQQLAEIYEAASSSDIKLKINNQLDVRLGTKSIVYAYHLHEATRAMAQNPAPPERVKNVVVLFAGSYFRTVDVFGIMFDEGFTTDDDENSNSEYHQHPREGCAIFLDTIRNRRPVDADFERETLFTTIHEMGHIFNLQHVDDKCYLASSKLDAPYSEDYYQFNDKEKLALSNCSTSPNIRPGGSKFGKTGPYGSNNQPKAGRSVAKKWLELLVDLPSPYFWPFEPVELDIELRVAAGAARSFHVLDRIDPGYEDLRIWIEEPTGERRLYRSPRRYCAYPSHRLIEPNRSFRRDVSIFGQAGGFTFRRSGVHRIWAEFMVTPGAWVRADSVEVEILGADSSSFYADARKVLSASSASRLLYHRQLRRGLRPRPLESFIAHHSTWHGVGRIEYGLGRAMLSAGFERSGARAKDYVERGTEYLKRAIDCDHLGVNQRRRAVLLVDEVSQS